MFKDLNNSQNSQNDNFVHKLSSTQISIKMAQLFSDKESEITCESIIILDNQIDFHLLQVLEPKCQNIIFVDGGANRIYTSKFKDSNKIRCIIGDFDSVKGQVQEYYHNKGVEVLHDPDQNTTDFQKTLNYCRKNGYKQIIFVNFYPGRIDHVLSAVSNTEKQLKKSPQKHIILIGLNTMMIYLHQKIDYTIHVKSERIEKGGCGMITFGKVNYIQTQGFKWNMGQNECCKTLEWGNFLSTSNQFANEKVKISSSDPLFFVAQIKQLIKVEKTW